MSLGQAAAASAEASQHTPMILLIVGIVCVFLGVFGGGFQIKEISIPKINNVSRAMGAVFGFALIVWSQIGNQLPLVDSAPEPKPVIVTEPTPEEPKDPVTVTDTSLLTGQIDELKPLWENLEISNLDILAEYQKIKEASDFDNLSLVYKSEVNNKLDELTESIDQYTKMDKELAGDGLTLSEKVSYLERFFAEDISKYRIAARDQDGLTRELNNFKEELEASAKIGSTNDFLTCKSIVNKNCSGSTSLFDKGEVWVWVKVIAPQSTEVSMKWVNLDNGEQINSRKYNITKSTGYRISASKSVTDSGKYEVRLFNKQNKLVARKQFQVR